MTSDEYLSAYGSRIDALIARNRAALDGLAIEQWNAKIDNPWTIAQILEHMHISASPYISAMQKSIANAPKQESRALRHTFIGSFIVKGAGPSGSAPAPKQMIPGPGPFDQLVLERFETDYRRFQDLALEAKGLDLPSATLPVPILPLFKLNLYDAFEIMAVHADRHVGQIETFAKGLRV